MFGRLAPKERDANRKLAQKAKGVKFFILGIASSFKFHAFLASDKHCEKLLLGSLPLPIRFGLESAGYTEPVPHQSHRRHLDGS